MEDSKALQDETQPTVEVSASQESSHGQLSKEVSPTHALNMRNVHESPFPLGFRTGSHDEIDGRGDVS